MPFCAFRQGATDPRGFSVVQFIVALALSMIVSTASVVGIRKALAAERLDGWTRAITFDVAAGRQAAMTRRTTVTVTLGSSSYRIATSGGAALRYASLPSDISITSTCTAGICSFDRRGIPIVAGSITLTSLITAKSRTVTIQLNTGRVSYQ